MKKWMVLILVTLANISFAQTNGQIRAEYVKANMASCVENQQTLPENKGISIQLIRSYCRCSAEYSANLLSNSDVKYLDGLSPNELRKNQMFLALVNKTTDYCRINFKQY
jgi:hypothetical protein